MEKTTDEIYRETMEQYLAQQAADSKQYAEVLNASLEENRKQAAAQERIATALERITAEFDKVILD